MNSKEIILNRIAGAAMPPVDYPAFDFTPLRFEDRTAAFEIGRASCRERV